MDDISSLISNVGFPIVCVLIMLYMFSRFYDSVHETIESLREAIEANGQLMVEVITKLGATVPNTIHFRCPDDDSKSGDSDSADTSSAGDSTDSKTDTKESDGK